MLFRNPATKNFANQLAQNLAKRYPPELDMQPGKRPSVNRLTRIMEETCEKAVKFRDENRLGWFANARFGNEFRWSLSEMGYSKEFVEFATEALIVYLSRNKRKSEGVA